MRKVLLLVALVLIASPAMGAVIIDVNTTGEPENVARIDYECTDSNRVRAFALDVSVDGGATIENVTDYHIGESNSVAQGYGIFPGSIQIDSTGEVDNYGSPVAPATAPDSPGQLGSSSITLEMGSLYDPDTSYQPALSGTLCRIEVSGATQMTITEDTTRGGVVLEDPDQSVSVDLTGATDAQIGTAECFPSGHPDYSEWETVGKPDSWCYPSQCYGDADGQTEDIGHGTYTVGDNDVAILVDGYTAEYSGDPATDPWIAADFDHASEDIGHGTYRVGDNDVSILVDWYTEESVPTDCLDY